MKNKFFILLLMFPIVLLLSLFPFSANASKDLGNRVFYLLQSKNFRALRPVFPDRNAYLNFVNHFRVVKYRSSAVVHIDQIRKFNKSPEKELVFFLQFSDDSSSFSLSFEIDSAGRQFFINPTFSLLKPGEKDGTEEMPNFIELAANSESECQGFNQLYEAYNSIQNLESASSLDENIPFDQIDFDPLSIELQWCKKIPGIKVCGTEVQKINYGKTISGSDIPAAENSGVNYFSKPNDIDAFMTSENNLYSQFKSFSLSSIILGKGTKELVVFSEGLIPFKYGKNQGDVKFNMPEALKILGNFVYVLDQG